MYLQITTQFKSDKDLENNKEKLLEETNIYEFDACFKERVK